MALKVFFIGNPFATDDGVGPYLFKELEHDVRLKDIALEELGVIGFDLISYVDDEDTLLIVDAVHTKNTSEVGTVIVLDESDLVPDMQVVSQHDFGVEQTSAILRKYKPNLKSISIIGIKVNDTQPFSDKLSDVLMSSIENIKEDVVTTILSFTKE